MGGSTGVMVKVKTCATFQETSAEIKEGCRCSCDEESCDKCEEVVSAIGDDDMDDERED
jgi:hypothetical protein